MSLIPFEPLVDERGRYLVERHAISYVSAGRDLLRLQVARASRSAPIVLANPVFGDPGPGGDVSPGRLGTGGAAAGGTRRSMTAGADLSQVFFAPLINALQEARDIQALFPDAQLLTGADASEPALKRVDAPRILHVATHGFFIEDGGARESAGAAPAAGGTRAAPAAARIANPLLRSCQVRTCVRLEKTTGSSPRWKPLT